MNKLFTRIAIATAGIAMAIGLGAFSNKVIREARADDTTYSFINASADGYDSWTASPDPAGYEEANRGSQWTSSFTLSLSNTEQIESVTLIASTNQGDANSIAVSVGGTDFECGGQTTVTMPKEANKTYQFTGLASGNIIVTGTRTNKSIYIKSITVSTASASGKLKVKYDGNGATSGSMTDSKEYESGDTVTIMACAFMRDNYEIVNWNTVADGSGTSYILSGTFTITQTVTLYAQWKYVGPGSEDDPYTVAEAIAAIDAAGSDILSDRYVTGIICQIDSYNSTYGSITYWISDDGTTTTKFQIYGGLSFNGGRFSSVEDLTVGYTVVVNGNLKKYKTTYEADANNILVSLTAPQVASVKSVASAPTEVYVGQEILPSQVLLNVVLTNSSETQLNATSIDADVSVAGTGLVGKAYYESVGYAEFTYNVVAQDFSGTHILSSTTTDYISTLTNDLFHENVANSEAFTATNISNVRLGGSPNTSDIMFYNTASIKLIAPVGYVITTVVFNAKADSSSTLTVGGLAATVTSSSYTDYSFYVFGQSVVFGTNARVWAKTISITLVEYAAADLASRYEAAFIELTAAECTAKSVNEGTWTNLSTLFSHIANDYSDAADLVREADESVDAIARYKVIVEKYDYNDFLEKGYQGARSFDAMNDSNMTFILIASITSLSAIALLLVIRKKKQAR